MPGVNDKPTIDLSVTHRFTPADTARILGAWATGQFDQRDVTHEFVDRLLLFWINRQYRHTPAQEWQLVKVSREQAGTNLDDVVAWTRRQMLNIYGKDVAAQVGDL